MKRNNVNSFFDNVAQIIEQARKYVGRTVDVTMCITYFEIGRMIVEEEQGGKVRATFGEKLVAELSAFLNGRFGRGFSVTTLQNARKFYLTYASSIQQTVFTKLENGEHTGKRQTSFALLKQGKEGKTVEKPDDMLKKPLILEFLGMDEKAG